MSTMLILHGDWKSLIQAVGHKWTKLTRYELERLPENIQSLTKLLSQRYGLSCLEAEAELTGLIQDTTNPALLFGLHRAA